LSDALEVAPGEIAMETEVESPLTADHQAPPNARLPDKAPMEGVRDMSYAQVLQTYMDALGRSDYVTIAGLFTADGKVRSPFLGEMAAEPFFDRLAQASETNVITPIDIFLSESGAPNAVAYFQYDWTVRDGTLISFKVMDLFHFAPESDRITYLDIVYDTFPIRDSHGNKYESPM
jgi:hypothetical protein